LLQASQQLRTLSVELPPHGTGSEAETGSEAKHMAQFGNGAFQDWSPKPGAWSPQAPPNFRLERDDFRSGQAVGELGTPVRPAVVPSESDDDVFRSQERIRLTTESLKTGWAVGQ